MNFHKRRTLFIITTMVCAPLLIMVFTAIMDESLLSDIEGNTIVFFALVAFCTALGAYISSQSRRSEVSKKHGIRSGLYTVLITPLIFGELVALYAVIIGTHEYTLASAFITLLISPFITFMMTIFICGIIAIPLAMLIGIYIFSPKYLLKK